MNDLLFDSSVWIDYFRKIESPQTDLLHTALLSDWTVWHCPTIRQEVLQGVKLPEELSRVQDNFDFLERLEVDPYLMADKAARIYRFLRKQGVTIRKPNDCLIAAYAIQFNLKVVHSDVDFDRIAQYSLDQDGILQIWSE
ncbi:type II toxin-antitoxin system VapC family toxin [Larkinella terrae]|uniref:PIN domain-containing protein n=1 Tax=Larkinella terrae TaxID=2025311 RepID=A0A7K0EMX4_9BACT|nr:PIN domain-containing protein [Larkinella terrae]MRS62891.1 PIN domain-containing protein [Larkinella terrae]